MADFSNIVIKKRDLIITSCKSMRDEEMAIVKSSKHHTIFEVTSNNDLDVSRQKLHQIQYLMSEDRQRKPFILITDYSIYEVSNPSVSSEPDDEAIEVVCFYDQLSWLINGKTLVVDASEKIKQSPAFSLTPIEAILENAMKNAGIEFEAQSGLGKYTADFIVRIGNTRFLVEADGRAYHNAFKDQKRDAEILKLYELQTLRLKGSEIYHNPAGCISKIKEFPTLQNQNTFNVKMESEDELDPSQIKAIKHQFGSARVVAPAGSGKTKVLVNHVAELIARGTSPTEILCLAFNRDAADQMRQRLGDLGIPCGKASNKKPGLVTVETFNAFGLNLLKQAGGNFDILDDQQKEKLALSTLDQGAKSIGIEPPRLRGQTPWLKLINEMSRIKSGLEAPDNCTIELPTSNNETAEYSFRPFFDHWEKASVKMKKITFDDQIYQSVSLLMDNLILRRSLQNRLRHIIVDEYQDLSPAQLALIKLISSGSQQVFAVGDDDQLIYAWRHVKDRNIADFEKSFGFSKTYKLNVNYRSSKSVVLASQRLISFNKNRIDKDIKAGEANPVGIAKLHIDPSIGNQLSSIVLKIKEIKKEQTSSGNSIVILTRHNAEQLLVAHALDSAGIPREPLNSSPSLYTTRAANKLLDYLLVIRNPAEASQDQLCNIINEPNRYLSNQFVEHLREQKGCWRYLKSFSQYSSEKPITDETFANAFNGNPPGISDKWRSDELLRFISLIESWNKLLPKLHPVKLIEDILRQSDFRKRQDKESIDQTEITDEMIIDLIKNEASKFKSYDTFLSHFIERSEYEKTGIKESEKEQVNKKHLVSIRTIHGAKGLEWETVFLFDIHDKHDASTGNIQGKRKFSISEEDRRVFYVALTRARVNLYVYARPHPLSSFILETFVPYKYRSLSNPAEMATIDSNHLEHYIKDLIRQKDLQEDNRLQVREKAMTERKSLEQRLKDLKSHLDENIKLKPSSWLSTKIFNGRMTFEQQQIQRKQLEEYILEANAKLTEYNEQSIGKQIKRYDRDIQNLNNQINHQKPILAELRREITNLEQISSISSPPK